MTAVHVKGRHISGSNCSSGGGMSEGRWPDASGRGRGIWTSVQDLFAESVTVFPHWSVNYHRSLRIILLVTGVNQSVIQQTKNEQTNKQTNK